MPKSFTLPDTADADRLDRILSGLLGLSLRQTRVLIQQGLVRIDGRPARKGELARPGQTVAVDAPDVREHVLADRIRVARRKEGFAAIVKPGGVHTVRGKGEPSLESCLEDLGLSGWILLNRLDFLTSGLVLAARSEEECARYKAWQDAGDVHKWYLALAHGSIAAGFSVRSRILDNKRRMVRVLEEEDASVRWTLVHPVGVAENGTIVLVRIRKGRRHQIRAHMASTGHPLLGDPLYGRGEPGGLFLHHWRMELPVFTAQEWPDWKAIDPAAVETARNALAG